MVGVYTHLIHILSYWLLQMWRRKKDVFGMEDCIMVAEN